MHDTFAVLKESRLIRHADWKAANTELLCFSEILFRTANGGEALLFREPSKPAVDFFPSTGRWRVAGKKETFRGGSAAFITWYKKQSVCPPSTRSVRCSAYL